ncbi:MAG: GNAT family N-acetyltransferase [Chloroflexi bacterium]|nr:GNAT family N-acetyltransferase [Chloroflexota bacterium]MBI2758133.1 GNAT family N-acetyltransferase [Chloroflexota bacterium]
MQIEVVTQADQKLWDAFQRLVPQLTSNNPPPSRDDLAALVKSESSTLIIARADDGSIIGAASLTVYRVPTGIRAIIEDVIVDESVRGRGIGEALVRRCLDIAREKGASGVSLTSNPKRKAANKLYQKMGFTKRETNAYCYRF